MLLSQIYAIKSIDRDNSQTHVKCWPVIFFSPIISLVSLSPVYCGFQWGRLLCFWIWNVSFFMFPKENCQRESTQLANGTVKARSQGRRTAAACRAAAVARLPSQRPSKRSTHSRSTSATWTPSSTTWLIDWNRSPTTTTNEDAGPVGTRCRPMADVSTNTWFV
jgi:hypothetical protein